MIDRKLRMGMVGGAIGSFIGPVHRMAAMLDQEAELIAGAFSSDPGKSKKTGEAVHLAPQRVYPSWKVMIAEELKRPVGDRIDFVTIVVPNDRHHDIAKAFLEAGFNVVCDKPLALNLAEAKDIQRAVRKSRKVFVLTHNYTGYPMVKQARFMVRQGMLGKINKVVVEYPQGWMAGFISNPSAAIGMWRMDPKVAGPSGCMGDLGTHAENLVRYITGLEIESLCADISTFAKINKLEDDANLLVHYKGGARGVLYASQISAGEENPLSIRVYGTKMGLEWKQEDPNYLRIKDPAGTVIRYSKGNSNLCPEALKAGRLIWGHPDGFIEAFANIYREAFVAIRAELEGRKIPRCDFPTVDDGVTGMAFIETILASAKAKGKWMRMKQ